MCHFRTKAVVKYAALYFHASKARPLSFRCLLQQQQHSKRKIFIPACYRVCCGRGGDHHPHQKHKQGIKLTGLDLGHLMTGALHMYAFATG